jgi:hypothetical protein
MNVLIKLSTIFLIVNLYSCYPTGAPLGKCGTMLPVHAGAVTLSNGSLFFIEAEKVKDFYRGKIEYCDLIVLISLLNSYY